MTPSIATTTALPGPPIRRGGLDLFLKWIPALAGLCVIAFESTGVFTAEHTSSWLRPVWQAMFGSETDGRWETIHHYIRKTGHFTGYGTLSLLFLRGWLYTLHRKVGENLWNFRLQCAALAILCTFLTASADEFHQTFLPGRTGVFSDVLLDTAGGITAHILFTMFYWSRKRK